MAIRPRVCVCVFRGGVGRRGKQRVSCHSGILVTLVSINEKGTELLAAPVHPCPLPQEVLQKPQGGAGACGGMEVCMRGCD